MTKNYNKPKVKLQYNWCAVPHRALKHCCMLGIEEKTQDCDYSTHVKHARTFKPDKWERRAGIPFQSFPCANFISWLAPMGRLTEYHHYRM